MLPLVLDEQRHVEGSSEGEFTGVGEVPCVVEQLGTSQFRDVGTFVALKVF